MSGNTPIRSAIVRALVAALLTVLVPAIGYTHHGVGISHCHNALDGSGQGQWLPVVVQQTSYHWNIPSCEESPNYHFKPGVSMLDQLGGYSGAGAAVSDMTQAMIRCNSHSSVTFEGAEAPVPESEQMTVHYCIGSVSGDSPYPPSEIDHRRSTVRYNFLVDTAQPGFRTPFARGGILLERVYSKALVHRPRYLIRVSPSSGSAESDTILTSVEPGTIKPPSTKDKVSLVAKVYDQNNQLVPNVDVELSLVAKHGSGGHDHVNDGLVGRTGKFSALDVSAVLEQDGQVLKGNTGADGLRFQYNAPAVGGDVDINAECTNGKTCTQQGPKQVWVGIKGLKALAGFDTGCMDLFCLVGVVGNPPPHPHNHYLTNAAMGVLLNIASDYKSQVVDYPVTFPPPKVLHLNDASLERGGIFDIREDWVRPHAEHCQGTVIDVRANDADGAIPPEERFTFERIARRHRAEPLWEAPLRWEIFNMPDWNNRHYHLKLLGQEGLQCPR